jgi:hypothetical protein
MYDMGGRATLGAWLPYEMSAMRDFYAYRLQTGSRLGVLDRLMLRSAERTSMSTADVRAVVSSVCGISFDKMDFRVYRLLLTYGWPTRR